jgi:hypothetical protein
VHHILGVVEDISVSEGVTGDWRILTLRSVVGAGHVVGTHEEMRCRWEDNIKTGRKEMGGGGGAWTGLIELRIGTRGGLLLTRQ